jgi:nucleoside-diphosphate-sugar epimerase
LITGANGFIGRYLVDEALRRNWSVWAGVRATSSLTHLPLNRIRCLDLKYEDPEALTQQFHNHRRQYGPWDYVIHNAGLTKATHPSDFFRVNSEYTRHLLDALATANCQPERFLLMSSLSTFGGGGDEGEGARPIRLDDLQAPDTAYGQSKLLAENYVREQRDFPYVILRPTGVYGPGEQDYRKAILSIRKGFDFAVGGKPQYITFIYVKDLVEVTFRALTSNAARNRAYFVADGDVYSDAQFARLIQTLLGKKRVCRLRLPRWIVYLCCLCSEWAGRITGRAMTLNTDKYLILCRRNWVCDVTALRNELDFTPAYNLREGLMETIRTDRLGGINNSPGGTNHTH